MRSYKQTGIIVSILFTAILLGIFYLVPSIFGSEFIFGYAIPIYTENMITGVQLVITNSYFLPVSLSYNGADMVIDIFDKNGMKVHRASFLKDIFHDDEEGYKHMARLPVGSKAFNLYFNESSQYYRNNTIPSLDSDQYILIANAFGKEITSK